jgi:hypothetical protein
MVIFHFSILESTPPQRQRDIEAYKSQAFTFKEGELKSKSNFFLRLLGIQLAVCILFAGFA